MEINTIDQVWEAISGERAISSKVDGDITFEEYELSDGTFLQVALDASLGGDPIEWIVTDESADEWLVG